MSRTADGKRSRWQTPIIYGVLLLMTFLVYVRTLSYDFVNYDDPDYVTANEKVQLGPTKEAVSWAFTTGDASNWHPLTWVSHMVDCRIYGLKPGGHHLTSVLFHVSNTLLLFGLLRKMTGFTWRSAFVAALFAWHPTHVESVAWISERKDVLSTFFWLLTMLAYVSYARSREFWVRYFLTLFLFALGLMSKPMLVTLPFVLLLLDYWPLGRIAGIGSRAADSENSAAVALLKITWQRALWEKAPFFLLVIVSCVVTFKVQQQGGAVVALNALPAGDRVANALVAYLRYVGKLIWPENLSVLYPLPTSWPFSLIVMATAFVVGGSCVALWVAKRRPYVFVGWFWFLGTLVPVIGLVQVGVQSMADRYLYVPAIGLFFALAWGMADLVTGWKERRLLLGIGASIALAACWLMTLVQIRYWQNGETLFRRAIAATKGNYLAYNNLGYFLENHGKSDEAMGFYRKSVEVKPNYEEAQNNLGHLLIAEGRYEEAVVHLRQALAIKPSLVEAHNNLGNALGDLGRSDEAIAQYFEALRYKTNDVDARNNLGIARAMQGRLDEAERLLREAVRLRPSDAGAHSNLGNVLALQRKFDEAMHEYQIAIPLNPNDPQVHFNLGNVFFELRKWAESAEQYATAIRLKPDNSEAHCKLGEALLAQDKREEALGHFREAVRQKPGYAEPQQRIAELTKIKQEKN